jgi:carboxypeptidase family protein
MVVKVGALGAALLLLIGFAPGAAAQVFTGGVDVSVQDSAGAPLSGVIVVLTGPIDETRPTDAAGVAHFVNVPVGEYVVAAQRQGFNSYLNRSVEVVSRANTAVAARLAATGTTEAAPVPPATPARDLKRSTMTAHIGLDELQGVPSSRDPWAVLGTVPSVYVDRVDVGGSESAEQAIFNGKGAVETDNTWALDGVPVTDMADPGTSTLFLDFDSFQELAVTTGGADARIATPGVQLDVVLKKGANAPHVNARSFFENDTLQGVNVPSSLLPTLGGTSGKGNRMDRYFDRGVDIGGPVFRDQLWAWGTIARTDVRLRTLTDDLDETLFQNRALKVDGLANPSVRGIFTYYQNNKIKYGRGVGPTRPPETTWNQTGPTTYYKGEGTFVGSDRLFASARAAYVDAGILLAPINGLGYDYYIDDGGVAHNTYYQYQSTRPQHFIGGDANYFVGPHELKAGGSWRSTPVDTQQTWPASHLVATWVGYPNMYVQAARDYRAVTAASYVSAFATDTISLDRATVTAGVRVDRQVSSLGSASVPGVAGVPLLPALSTPAVQGVYTWTNVTPRVGVSYAVDSSRQTIVRASYAMFASQLPATQAAFVSPIQHAYAYYNAVDRNGDGVAQATEILFSQGLQGYSGFDPGNPSRQASVNTVDPNVKAPITHELHVGVDRQIGASFGVAAAVTYRRVVDVLWEPLTGVRSSDYVQTGTLSGSQPEIGAYSVPVYALKASAVPVGGGETSTNRPGYHQQFFGVDLSATKRLSRRWSGRFGFSTNKWREYFDDPSAAILDPTKAPAPSAARPFAGPQVDGGLVVRQTSGSGRSDVYMVSPAFQIVANGTYEGPWGISGAANLVTRQGYVEPFFQSNVATGDPLGRKSVLLVRNVDDFRLDTLTSLDARIEKRFVFSGTNVAIDFDVFNVLNAGTVLGKQYDARLSGATGFDQPLEIMNPRVARVGVRFFF